MILSKENKELLVKHGKSLLWRFAMMTLATSISFALDHLSLFSVPPSVTVVIGLVLGEISKLINQKLSK